MCRYLFSFAFLIISVWAMYAAYCQPAVDIRFDSELLHQFDQPVYSIEAGDLDDGVSGLELAVQLASGAIVMIHPADGSQITISEISDPIATMAERPTLSIADVDPRTPGLEAIAAGPKRVQVVSREQGAWSSEEIFNLQVNFGMLWGARAADFTPERPGDEIFLIWEGVFDFSSGYYYRADENGWNDEHVYQAEVGMDSAVGECDPGQPGPEHIVVTEMGPAYVYNPYIDSLNPWHEIWNDFDNAAWTLAFGDVMPEREGDEVVYGTRYNNRILVSYPSGDGAGHVVEMVMQGKNREHPHNMWDVDAGDLIDEFPGDEIVAVDNTGRLYLAWRESNRWEWQTIWHDQGHALHNVLIADLDLQRPGDEIAVSSSSGAVRLLYRAPRSSAANWAMY